MDEVEIQVVEAQILQRLFARHLDVLRPVERAPELARDVKILSAHQS